MHNFFEGRERILDAFESKIFSIKSKVSGILNLNHSKLKRLLIVLAQVKAGNNSESFLNEIRQIVYSLYQSKQITQKIYNNIIKSIQQHIKMSTIFMKSENIKTSKSNVLALKLTNKLDLRIGEKTIFVSNLSICYIWRNIKNS